MHRNLRLTNRAGYSLIEMMVTITVMSILMGITLLAMAPQIRQSKVGSAANVVVGDLQYAQSLAVRYRRPVEVIVQEATRQYIIQDRDSPGEVYRIRHLGQDSEFSLDSLSATPINSPDPPLIQFYPNGVALKNIDITLGLGEYARQVRLTKAGQIRIVRN